MRFTIQRDKLINGVSNVMKAISARTVIPILTGMKIEVKNHGVTLTGSDSDISIEYYIPTEEEGIIHVENIEEGTIILQAKYFPDIVRKLPESTVDIVVDDQLNVRITSGKAEFNLNGQSAEEYPQLPKVQTENSFELPIDLLKSMIKQTVFAVSTMETRPILTGVNMKLVDNLLSFTATDSHRLARREIPVSNAPMEVSQIVVPGKSLNELNKILADSEETVEISVTNNQILFRTKHLNFLSRLLDGNYPETSRLIPEQSKTKIQVKTKELLGTIDRASLLAKEERNNVVKFNAPGNSMIEISSNSPEVGNVVEEITADQMEGEEVKISFSSKYMIDALKAIEYDEVQIEFTGAMRPFIIRPVGDDSILQLILPVRTY
ncbi:MULTISPECIES: DNA polymerase III subunit beta [Oceanobacillus]|uniref:Beta sliding clamp n=1 Tax=Oceanobacillus kimchii TaxID=746691 RepID=A0ABQ5TCD7_9BACI|nr:MULTISPECIES: DNA polymerase III subunit beta [Oceanobacillus]MBT2599894.1 DNA polymerase III subunit beta [Oceanobacillus sp. ISL-74]MBT2652656.1 DNA polymerase III subunit beta [Oceanobacillus sp. ISL-73]MCT1577199.1 DNA polymerase III subunit beta [Oceanobacillus kimchii]MCT2135269.1 DNA polymerase III subunit beta [Oceanobacillus kimchii]GLO64218.1 DNA polymerase III subunit beta [Oceanobacillus kimchii]